MTRPIEWPSGGWIVPCSEWWCCLVICMRKEAQEMLILGLYPLSLPRYSSVCDNKGLFRITMGSSIKHRIVIGWGGDAAAGWIWICGGWIDGWVVCG